MTLKDQITANYIDENGRFVSSGEDETIKWGMKFAEKLNAGSCIFLIGDLGSGKTVLAKGISAGLGFEGLVSSPSFTLQHLYQGRVLIHHCDLYRLNPDDNLVDFGFEEIFEQDSVSIFEWAENFPIAENHPRWEVRINIGNSDLERIIDWNFING